MLTSVFASSLKGSLSSGTSQSSSSSWKVEKFCNYPRAVLSYDLIVIVHLLHEIQPVQELLLGPDELSPILQILHLDANLWLGGLEILESLEHK